MADLLPADVQAFTNGRLSATDPEVIRMLAAALSVARREVGWHVSPVRSDDIDIDGPDSRVLWLPTLKLVTLTGVEEDGTALDLDTIKASKGDGTNIPRQVSLRKNSGGYWTGEYGGINVTYSHGYTETEAADWRQAVLSMVDQMSLLPISGGTGVSEFGLSGKRVDDVDYRYNPYASMADEVVFSMSHVFCSYTIPALEYF